MSIISLNGHDHYFEILGEGTPIVFIHGAFVDSQMWAPQTEYFSDRFQVTRYDLRGHGKTGASLLQDYSIRTFSEDLSELIGKLKIESPILCGLSLGGMIAQDYAVRNPNSIRSLLLADTAVSVSLTLGDKLQRYVLFPKWAMKLTIRWMGVQGFTRFSFWLARATRSEKWIGYDQETRTYVEERMLQMDQEEYLKVYDAIYDFKLLPLERITAPTLVLNGEYEAKNVYRHTEEILRRVPNSKADVVPRAGHTSNMENPQSFNELMQGFITHSA
jgi:pimeloyl-ACP methyl ester carboxylesterase